MIGAAILTGALAILGQAAGLSSAKFLHPPKARENRLPKLPGVPAVDVVQSDFGFYNGTFTQPIDHFNPDLGNFTQRFWFDTTYWQGPGSPVFLFMPGEDDASKYLGYLYNNTLSGLYAQEFGGMVIVIEHRYWGESLPFDTLTAETLQYLQLPQSMLDMTNFAANASFDLGNGNMNDNATAAPWVLMGGSYPGALTAWIQQKYPGVFWAYHASSAVVETITDFYQYFEPIANALPTNCTADIRAVVQYVDYILGEGDDVDIAALKKGFGLLQITDNSDFAGYLAQTVWGWQDGTATAMEFCDYLETGVEPSSNGTSDSVIKTSYPNGVGLTTALKRYQYFIRETFASTATNTNETANNQPDDFTDSRQWYWLICDNPFGWFQVGGGENGTKANTVGLISSYLDVDSYKETCRTTFPTVNGFQPGILEGYTPEHLDLYTNGWNGQWTRTIFVNGGIDPWRSATVSSDYRPDGPMVATADDTLVFVVPSGDHCPELTLQDYPEMPKLYGSLIKTMRNFLDDWGESS